ncbi:U6 snRNA phosphodiesterase 1 [Pelodytes ibericus]
MFEKVGDEKERDDITQHGGRMRSFQHERGNWATYVYIPLQPPDEFHQLLDEIVSVLTKHKVVMNKMTEFHISQSQTIVLRHHWISPFVQSLRERLGSVCRFLCIAGKIQVYTNKERTRTFLGLEVSTGKEHLLEVVSEVDQSVMEFNLQTFYQDPSFHISLAWCVGDARQRIEGVCLKELQNVLDGFEDSHILTRFYADEIRCKTGNKIFCISLT